MRENAGFTRADASRTEVRRLIEAAHQFARGAHEGQRRADGKPYISHPETVVRILVEHGIDDGEVLAAAYLHDVLEDTAHTREELLARFGGRVTAMVEELTDLAPPGATYQEKSAARCEQARRMSESAKLVKLADRIHNLESRKAGWSAEKQRRYVEATFNLLLALQPVPIEGRAMEQRLRALIAESMTDPS